MILRTQKKQRGLTLIETLFYIVIIISVVAGSITYFKAASRAQKLADAVSETADLLQVAAQYWESNMTFVGLTDSIAVKSGLIPVKYTNLITKDNIGKIATPWTEINPHSTVSFVPDAEAPAGSIAIVFSGIPNYACASLAQQLTNTGYPVKKSCGGYKDNEENGNGGNGGDDGNDSSINIYNSTVTISVGKR